jgi:hypothetical protein
MSHSQNIILYISIQYINIINHILQLKMLYYFEKFLKSLQHNVHRKPPVSYCLNAALYCPALPRTVPLPLLGPFESIYNIYVWDRGPVNSFFIRRGPGPNK